MAGVPVKFRCYRCNQLLGVSRTKVGAIVACPKCAAELVVPEPTEPAPASVTAGEFAATGSESPQTATQNSGRASGLDVGLALDFLSIRPEDIRVEPGFPDAPEPEPEREPDPEPEPPSIDVAMAVSFVASTAHSVIETPPPPPRSNPTVAAPPPTPEAVMAPNITQQPPTVPVPPIQLDAPLKRSARRPQPVSIRARDLVLPRSVVASWSLFVILALAFAFLAGLLAGHYIWRVH